MNFGSYLKHMFLKTTDGLALTRRAARLARKIAPLKELEKQEKATRAALDGLLDRAGLQNLDIVQFGAYEVTHYVRKGQSSLNETTLADLLVAAGVERELVTDSIAKATETADDVKFCAVKPAANARVLAPRQQQLRPAA